MFGAIQLKMLHVKNGEASRDGAGDVQALLASVASGPHFRWDTCLRTVAIFPDQLLDQPPDFPAPIDVSTAELLSGEAAYEKLLELICGLHSPMVGETEVFGQFKEAVQKFQSENGSGLRSAFHQAFQAWANGLLEDAKKIRRKHLQDLGSQSYGSLVRRELRELGSSAIDVLGAGRLVADILPWISKKTDRVSNQLTVHCRDLSKAQKTLSGFIAPGSSFLLENLHDPKKAPQSEVPSVLLIAAPMSAFEIRAWMKERNRSFDLILDLRGESRQDFLAVASEAGRYVSLEEFFRAINDTKKVATRRREAALSEVRSRRQERESMAYHRPFGWDDV